MATKETKDKLRDKAIKEAKKEVKKQVNKNKAKTRLKNSKKKQKELYDAKEWYTIRALLGNQWANWFLLIGARERPNVARLLQFKIMS